LQNAFVVILLGLDLLHAKVVRLVLCDSPGRQSIRGQDVGRIPGEALRVELPELNLPDELRDKLVRESDPVTLDHELRDYGRRVALKLFQERVGLELVHCPEFGTLP
jgi:hypothetical protein